MQASPQDALKRQLRSQADRPSGPFACQKCDKSFSRIENLTRHSENHKANGKFACNICQKRFTRSDILKRHAKIHTAEESERRQALLRGTQPNTIRHADQRNDDEYRHHHVQPDIRLPKNPGVQIQPAQPDSEHQNIINSNPIALQPTQGNGHLAISYDERLHNRMHGLHGTVPQNPIMIPSPESVTFGSSWSDGYYGIYGEGSFDADLAWILDMAPMSSETIQRMQERLPVAGPAPDSFDPSLQIPQQVPQQGVSHLSVDSADGGQTSHQASIENRNNWPDVDELPGAAPTSVEESTYIIPDSRSWVDWGELSSPLERPRDAPAQSYTLNADIRARLIQTLIENASYKDGLLPPDDAHFPVPEVSRHTSGHIFDIDRALIPTSFNDATWIESLKDQLWKVCGCLFAPCGCYVSEAASPGHYIDNILTLLFLCLSGAWCGHKAAFEFAEGARGILVTASRRCKLLDCRPKPLLSDTQQPRNMRTRLNDSWRSWVKLEQRKRLGLSIFMFDLQFPALFHNQPYISKAETVNLVLPCDAAFWEAKSAESWKVLLGPAEIPASTYFMVPLDTCLLYPAIKREPPYAPIDSYSKTLLMYALFTHIFEWRQSLNIVLHSAFIRGPEHTTPGEGLKERQGWLQDALDAWLKNYHRPDGDVRIDRSGAASPAALLLYCLAEIYLEISISDLHQFAGRSGLSEDIKLAEDSLRRWCRSSRSARTVHRVHEMLDLAHQTIECGFAHECAFEIAVALLTGGLTCWMYEKLGGQASSGTQVSFHFSAFYL
ncbi:C2H2 type zinc finger domain protein [Talaromyces pinophilus]|uniref:C2H2 type zinc finger domain protein n=1 Tax=Talaromyces pinophilus TaxID=128442 RepID=A0A0B8MZ81_TALPI|nr:C2H2 type zinc finger domain protein [Talaromyces pinophilus]